jgi:hypothetical protein
MYFLQYRKTALYDVGRTKDQDERLKELTKQRRNVWRARAAELSIFRTPTLILADPSGKIRARWVGSVPPDLERDVLSNLMAGRSYPRYRTTTRDEFVKSRVAHPDAQILALRDPKKVSPLEGARYIPFDEFGVRVEYELKRDKPVYVDCQGTDNFTCQRALTQLNKLAFTDVIGIGLPKHRRSCEAK